MSTIAIEVPLNSYNIDSDNTMNEVPFWQQPYIISPQYEKKNISTIKVEAQVKLSGSVKSGFIQMHI